MGHSPKFCISCGAALSEGQRFCHECGVRINADISDDAQELHNEESVIKETPNDLGQFDSSAEEVSAEEAGREEAHTQSALDNTDSDSADSASAGRDSDPASEDDVSASADSDELNLVEDESSAINVEKSTSATNEDGIAESAGEDSTVTKTADEDGKPEVLNKEPQAAEGAEAAEDVEDLENVSDIDISDGIQDAFDAMKTAQIPPVPISVVPSIEDSSESRQNVTASSVGPGSTSPMPLVNTDGFYAPGQDTQVMEAVPSSSAAPRQYRQDSGTKSSPAPKSESPQAKRTILIVLVVILAIAVVALAGALAMTLNNQQGVSNQSQETSATQSEQASTQNPKTAEPTKEEESAEAEEPTSSEDRTYYYELKTYYDRLGSYHDEISAVAQDFNNNYMKTSWSKRSTCASSAGQLADQISNNYETLQDLYVPPTSEYYDCYNTLLACYYDCIMRVSVICEAWQMSLSYDDPSGHSDEICEPLSRDKENGANKYLTEFNELYKNAKPAEPRD